MTKYQLLCFAPDGDYVKDSESNDIKELEENSANMGSKWIFYPFHFICTKATVKEAGDTLEYFNGKRIQTVVKAFQKHSDLYMQLLN